MLTYEKLPPFVSREEAWLLLETIDTRAVIIEELLALSDVEGIPIVTPRAALARLPGKREEV